MNVTFDVDIANRHVSRVGEVSDVLGDTAKSVQGQDVSEGFGIMCSFLAPSFIEVAEAVDEALGKAKNRVDTLAQNLCRGVANLEDIDSEARKGFDDLTGGIVQ